MPRHRKIITVLMLIGIGLPATGFGELCSIDAVPAATLLLPYFGVDPAAFGTNKDAVTTFDVVNESAGPILARLTVWSDMAQPALAFDIELPAYGAVNVNLNELFVQGTLPEGALLDCPPTRSQRASAGSATLSSRVLGALAAMARRDAAGETVAEGYVTIDHVNRCSGDLLGPVPGDTGYFEQGGTGLASNRNVLSGQYFVSSKKFIAANRLVAIEAGDTSIVTTPGNYTFYGKLVGFDASDNREPLASKWNARYLRSDKRSTYLIVWRGHAGFGDDLTHRELVAFDGVELRSELPTDLFSRATQEVRVNASGIPSPYEDGWLFADLDHPNYRQQSHVTIRQDMRKRRSLYDASVMDSLALNELETDITPDTACGPAPEIRSSRRLMLRR